MLVKHENEKYIFGSPALRLMPCVDLLDNEMETIQYDENVSKRKKMY